MGDKDNKIAKDILRYISFFFIETYESRMIQEKWLELDNCLKIWYKFFESEKKYPNEKDANKRKNDGNKKENNYQALLREGEKQISKQDINKIVLKA